MDTNFWQQKWSRNELGFHLSEANPLLTKHLDALSLTKGARIFLPLCGKTRDIAWLLSQGYRVVGAELVKTAIEQLFDDLQVTPIINTIGSVERWSAHAIDIFVGDIFELTTVMLGPVDAIYDRAALVALPDPMRRRYAAHIITISETAPQLLISYTYDQSKISGPPFSVPDEEIRDHYQDHYAITQLASIPVPGGMKGISAAEKVWALMKA